MKLFAKILVIAWITMWLALAGATDGETLVGNFILSLVQSIAPAFVFALIAWLFVRRRTWKSPLISPPVCTMLIIVGLVAFGGTYGRLRDSGVPVGAASLSSLLGWAGILFVGAVAMLILSKNEERNA